jgi:hypothetical protein
MPPPDRPVAPAQLLRIGPSLEEVRLMSARIGAMGIVFLVGLSLVCLGLLKPIVQLFHWVFSPIVTTIGVVLIALSIIYVFQIRISTMSKAVQIFIAFFFGVVFVGTLMVVAFVFPHPSPFQYLVFRIVLALAAAGIAAMIPGFLEVKFGKWLRATGAIAVFAIVYFLNPAALAV